MTDFLTKEQRSTRMSAIKGRNNKTTELALMALFRRDGIKGWRRHYSLPGRPDFVFPKMHLAIFVDGCFWHACPKHYKLPASNTTFWATKARTNRKRDRRQTNELQSRGWQVLRVWEHAFSDPELLLKRIRRRMALAQKFHASAHKL